MTKPSRAVRTVLGFLLAGLATAVLMGFGLAPAPSVPVKLMLFVGRFHPLIVHLPIGFLAAIAALQALHWIFRFDFGVATRVLLWLCAMSALASTAVGTLLAWPGGYSGELLSDHRWFGIATSTACVWMLLAHHFTGRLGRAVYSLLLVASLGLVSATGHYGGSLTHGEDYLTANMPVALGGKPDPLPVNKGTKEDAAIYIAAIQPIIEAKCVECHNPSKSNGNLRMDTMAQLLAGGKHGAALKPGDADASLMIGRANLPLDNKEHMPPVGKPQLADAELELLSWWINRGAKERLPLIDDLPPPAALTLLENKLGFPVAAPGVPMLAWEEVVKVGAALAKVPNLAVRRSSMDSPALNIFIASAAPDPDALIASLEPIKANIVLLDTGKTKISKTSFPLIAGFTNLEELRLQETKTTDLDVAQLTTLRKLKKINLNSTEVTDRSVDFFSKFPNLTQLAAWDTTVSPDAAKTFVKTRFPENKKRHIEEEIKALNSRLIAMKVEVLGIDVPDRAPPPTPAPSPSPNPKSNQSPKKP
jgi:mono/diheme cytochrome c family protein